MGAAIYFADGSGLRSDYHSGKIWTPKGQAPVVESAGARFRLNMMAAIDNRGNIRIMSAKETVPIQRLSARSFDIRMARMFCLNVYLFLQILV